MSFKERAEKHPVITILSLIILTSGSITAVGTITGYWDRQHTSEAELVAMLEEHSNEPHEAAVDLYNQAMRQLEFADRRNQCSNIDVRIALLEDQIWHMEQDNSNSQRIVEKKRRLRNLESVRETLNCSEFDV